MKIKLVPPAIVYYTDGLKSGRGGEARGPIVRIRPKYERDEGIHQHELEHVRQWWVTLALHSFLYPLVRRYRLWSEARAYRAQTWFPDVHQRYMTLDEAALRLTGRRYRLHISQEEAKQILQG